MNRFVDQDEIDEFLEKYAKEDPVPGDGGEPLIGGDDRRFFVHASIRDFKQGDDGVMVLRGYANTKNIDRVRDIVDPSAFRRSLRKNIRKLKILDQHDPDRPIGLGRRADIREKGLFVEAEIKDIPLDYVQTVRMQIEAGLKDSFSIGFQPLASEWIPEGERPKQDGREADRRITDLDLFEISVVTIPANMQSVFNVVKAVQHGTDLWVPSESRYLGTSEIVAPANESSEEGYEQTIRYIRDLRGRDHRKMEQAIEAIRQTRGTG